MPEFICFLTPTRSAMPDDPTPEEAKTVAAHLAYYQRLLAGGSLTLAGRTQEPPHTGIAIFNTPTKEDAISLAAQDPAVAAGVFSCKVQSYQTALDASR